MKIWAVALNTFRESLRNKILYSVLFFVLLLVAVSAFFGAVSIGSQERVIKSFGLFSLSFFGAIIAILIGVTLLNTELKRKTIYNILSKPVERWQFIVGKYLGLVLTVSLLVSFMGVALIIFVSFFEGQIDFLLFQGILLAVLEIAIVSSIVIFFSSITVTTTLAGLFTLGFYLAGRSIHYLHQLLLFNRTVSDSWLRHVVRLLYWLLPDLRQFSAADQLVYGIPVAPSQLLYGTAYAGAYILVSLTLAVVIFSRREML